MIKLVCLDMDGVLTKEWNFWLKLHDAWGTTEEGRELTKKYLRTDFTKLMEEVLDRLWVGKDEAAFLELVNAIPLSPHIEEFFATIDDIPKVIISGGPIQLAERISRQFPIDLIFANELVFENGIYHGKYHWHMNQGTRGKTKALHEACQKYGVKPGEVFYVGDDTADLEVFHEVGVSVAFHAKDEELKKTATYVVDSDDLLDVIPFLKQHR